MARPVGNDPGGTVVRTPPICLTSHRRRFLRVVELVGLGGTDAGGRVVCGRGGSLTMADQWERDVCAARILDGVLSSAPATAPTSAVGDGRRRNKTTHGVASRAIRAPGGPVLLAVPAMGADGRQPVGRRNHMTRAGRDDPSSTDDVLPAAVVRGSHRRPHDTVRKHGSLFLGTTVGGRWG